MASQSSAPINPVQSSSLSRGQACITCRRKKVKCDGVRPFCGPCSLTRNPDHCEYTNKQGRTFTEVLEERLRLLKARIKELGDQPKDAPVLLRDPYSQRLGESRSCIANFTRMGSPAQLSEPPDPVRVLSEVGSEAVQLELPLSFPEYHFEQPVTLQNDQGFEISTLLQIFLPHATRLHFALHIPTFLQDSACPIDDPLRPHACLMSSIFLWALCIIGLDTKYAIHESYHLKFTLESIPVAHSSTVDRYRVQAIQAEVLLALYFFNDARVLEGRYHMAAAGVGVLACELHRIVASHNLPNSAMPLVLFPGLGADSSRNLLLDTPRDALELGERINVFWTVYALDRCWNVALGCPPAIVDNPTTGAIINSPFPRPLEDYQNLSVDDTLGSAALSTCAFFDGSADYSILAQPSSSNVAFLVAAALFERATRIAGSQNDVSPDVKFFEEIERLGESITRFNDALQEHNTIGPSSTSGVSSATDDDSKNETCMRIIARSLGFAATIELQYPLLGRAEADAQCRTAVRKIVSLFRRNSEFFHGWLDKMDFFLGIVWLSAARVLLTEAAVLSSTPTTPTHTQVDTEMSVERSGSSAATEATEATQEARQQVLAMLRVQEIAEDLETLLGVTRTLGQTCPLICSQLEAFEELRKD